MKGIACGRAPADHAPGVGSCGRFSLQAAHAESSSCGSGVAATGACSRVFSLALAIQVHGFWVIGDAASDAERRRER
jgi:hypothetical protein